ncbi:alginate export family protein [Kangiella spongicola]|uniref:Alginate export domain-containing protein n=1 Tax=Kangiella spongicola TaxID=796379 RepID=A0A318D6W7_9GAMM|nr:alginate export family protein [Kangiella spongicola]PXF63645.1 hypothetical protein DL796_00370 [Kangiella spongicola]
MKPLQTSLAIILAISPFTFLADKASGSDKEELNQHNVTLDFRYRLEDVSQSNLLDDALASTLRSRLTFTSKEKNDFSAIIEFDDVRTLFTYDEHNSLRNGILTHSVVADPEGTELNQAAVLYRGFGNTQITLGRQRINLGNQRFVGGVAWRQNEQTYDAVTIENHSFADSTLKYGYLENVNNILGDNEQSNSHLFDYHWSGAETFQLSAFGYFLDFKDSPNKSSRTLGLRISNTKPSRVVWNLSYAKQADFGDNPNDLSASYYQGELGYRFDPLTLKLGREVLSGEANNPGQAFQTPLATKHKFQGWADQFLVTPDAGIEDNYLALNTGWDKIKLTVSYHDYQAEDSNLDYGSEINVALNHQLSKEYSLSFKLADYNAKQHSVDTRKAWFMIHARF